MQPVLGGVKIWTGRVDCNLCWVELKFGLGVCGLQIVLSGVTIRTRRVDCNLCWVELQLGLGVWTATCARWNYN